MMLQRRPSGVLLALTVSVSLSAALSLAGCTTSAGPGGTSISTTPSASSTSPTPAPSETATSTATSTPSIGTSGPGSTDADGSPSAAPFPANTLPDTGDATGLSVGTLTDLRVGAHDGFDRVVLEFNGPDTPDWNVRYVAQAVGDASGLPIHVTGDAILEITCFSVAAPPDATDPYTGPATVSAAGTTAITEVTWSSLFEGYLQAFVGVTGGQHPFRAYALSDPARIVVEVRTD